MQRSHSKAPAENVKNQTRSPSEERDSNLPESAGARRKDVSGAATREADEANEPPPTHEQRIQSPEVLSHGSFLSVDGNQDGYGSDAGSVNTSVLGYDSDDSSVNDIPEICQIKLIFGGDKRLHYDEEELQERVAQALGHIDPASVFMLPKRDPALPPGVRLEVEVLESKLPASLNSRKARRVLMNQVRAFPSFQEIGARDITIEWVEDFTSFVVALRLPLIYGETLRYLMTSGQLKSLSTSPDNELLPMQC